MRALLWFRNDLRLYDHPALDAAMQASDEIVPVYVLDERYLKRDRWGFPRTGPFRLKFLLESLEDLQEHLSEKGSQLLFRTGIPEQELPKIAEAYGCSALYASREYTHEEVKTEEALSKVMACHFSHGTALYHPDDIPFSTNKIPEVFTPFRKRVERYAEVRRPLPVPEAIASPELPDSALPEPGELGIKQPPADERAAIAFHGGAREAKRRLNHYLWETKSLSSYKETRNGLIGADYSSKFSPWLANGCLSPRDVYEEVGRYEEEVEQNKSTYWLIFELLWRDYFKFVAMKHGRRIFFPGGIQDKPVNWKDNDGAFERWRTGTTGDGFVDANMRELLYTGFMSNRGRQNVASFLVHQLKQDWRRGAAWFESALTDYDVCSNYGNWMYAAGVGNDPRGRVFNTQKQAGMYDADGAYRQLWLEGEAPELVAFLEQYF